MTSCLGAVALAEDTAEAVSVSDPLVESDLAEAREFIELISGKVLFSDGDVTRAAYVKAILDFMQIPYTEKHDEYFFSDVKSFSAHAPAVYTAVANGWISRGSSFEPERIITPTEALKILVCAMNYELISVSKGGYPAGDLYVAKILDLTESVDMNLAGLDARNAYKLLFNAACAPTLEQVSFGDTEEYEKSGESLLGQIYGISFIEGIVSRTPYNTLSGSESIELGDVVEIDGAQYKSNVSNWDILGCRARAFVKEIVGTKDEIVYLRDLSERITINLADFEEKTSTSVSYWKPDGTKRRTEKLSMSCQYIYNGRKISSNIDSYIKKGPGNLVLVDNDEDGTYDVVYINSYSYLTALGYDSVTETVRDKYSSHYTVCIDDIPNIVMDEKGNIMDPIDIASGDVLRVEKSADGGFIKLSRVKTALAGIVNEINSEEGIITVDDTEYIMSDYFVNIALRQIGSTPVEISLIYDGNIIVAASPDGGDMQYGYLTGIKWVDGMETDLMVRIYTQSGTFGEYVVREKTIIDGVRNNDKDTFYEKLSTGDEAVHQLVRFGLDGNGELRAIDLASDVLPDSPGVYGDPLNKLTRYTFTNAVRYRSNISAMSTLYNVVNSIVFNIPSDIGDDENFLAGNKNLFVNDKQYNPSDIEVYNLDSFGCAEALVYRNDNPNQTNPDSVPLLVRSVNNSLDADGNEVYTINGWCNGSFVTLYLSPDVEFTKKSIATNAKTVKSVHPLLSGGDIIKYAADGTGNIKSIEVIFDARENVFAMNDSRVNQINYDSPQYYVGKVYDVGNNFAVISVSGDDFSQSNLRYASLSTNSIVQYNARTGDTRPISASEIKTYKSNGTDAHYAIFCMNNLNTKTVVLYEETEAR